MAMATLTSQLLIASPRMEDPNFAQSVVLVVQHDEEGAFGLVLNRPSDTDVKALWKQVGEGEGECRHEGAVHIGGPCGGPLMALHTAESAGQRQVLPGLWFTSDAEDLRWLIDNDPSHLRFYLGYAGWAAGQLESEVSQSAWLVLPATMDAAFEHQGVWSRLVGRVLGVPGLWPRLIPPDPTVN